VCGNQQENGGGAHLQCGTVHAVARVIGGDEPASQNRGLSVSARDVSGVKLQTMTSNSLLESERC
jgi:hypothetical protein